MPTWIIFLRGVNVGGHRKLPMAELRKVLAEAGYEAPRSYIQSGNVVLGSDQDRGSVEIEVGAVIKRAFGFDVTMSILSRTELATAVAECPYAGPDADPSRVHLFFHIGDPVGLEGLAAEPEDPARLAEGRIAHYMHTPLGLSHSRLAELVSRRLKDCTTVRNLRTCQKMLDLSQ